MIYWCQTYNVVPSALKFRLGPCCVLVVKSSTSTAKRRGLSYVQRGVAWFYIQLVFKAPLFITLRISDQKIVSGSLFFQLFSTISKKKKDYKSHFM